MVSLPRRRGTVPRSPWDAIQSFVKPAAHVGRGLRRFKHVRAGRLRFDRVAGLAVSAVQEDPRVLVADQVPRVEQDVRRRVRPADQVVDRSVHRSDSASAACAHCDLRIRATSCGRSLSTYLTPTGHVRPHATADRGQLGRGQHLQGRATRPGHGGTRGRAAAVGAYPRERSKCAIPLHPRVRAGSLRTVYPRALRLRLGARVWLRHSGS